MNQEEIIDLLADYCRGEANETDTGYDINFTRREENYTVTISSAELTSIIDALRELNVHDETALFDDYSYEVIVKEESNSAIRRLRDDQINVSNTEAGIDYELSYASDVYLVWLLNEMRTKLSPRDFRYGFYSSPRLERRFREEGNISIFEYIRLTSFRLLTLKLKTTKKTSSFQYAKLTHSFLFHIGYNLDIALVPQRLLEELARTGRITRMRRSRIEDLDPPRRTYTESLVQHYLLAVSTDNPVIEYLSYYHVFEHFFEAVFNDDLLESIKYKITDPSFSYKRKKDIQSLVKTIKKSLQIRSETITFSESEALRLCLEKFVTLDDLKIKINEYDETLLEYYKSNKVPFSQGNEVDLTDEDTDKVFKNLTKRIYSTRNALVHSKDGDSSKYTPFQDDRLLVKEVPLMRFISEMVILSESHIQ